MRHQRFRFVLRVELTRDKVRVARAVQLNHLYKLAVGRNAAEDQALLFEHLTKFGIEFESMPVAFTYLRFTVICLGGQRPFLQIARPFAEPHRSAHFIDADQVAELKDDRERSFFVELGRIRIFQAANVSGKFDTGRLHSQTDPEIWGSRPSCIFDSPQHSRNAAFPKSARYQDRVEILQLSLVIVLHQVFRLDPGNIYAKIIRHARVRQRLSQRFVGIFQLDIFSDYGDLNRTAGRVFDRGHKLAPVLEIEMRKLFTEVKVVDDKLVKPLVVKRKRHLIDRRHVEGRYDRVLLHVTEQSDLSPKVHRQRSFRPTQKNIGCDTDLAKFFYRVLCRLCLQFAGGSYIRNERNVDKYCIPLPFFVAYLADRFHKRQRLDIADRSADLDDQNIRLMLAGNHPDRGLDLVCDVRDNLDGLAEIIAAAFLFDDRKVDPAAGPVVRLREFCVGEPFVMAKVEIGLGAVVGNKHLAVLERGHRARIDVDIRVQLHHLHRHPAGLQQAPDRTRGKTFAETRNHTAGYENIFCFFLDHLNLLKCTIHFVPARRLHRLRSTRCRPNRLPYLPAFSFDNGLPSSA